MASTEATLIAGPRQPGPGGAGLEPRAAAQQLGPNLIAPEAAEQAQTSLRRRAGHLAGDPRAARAVARQPAGGPDNLAKTRLTSPIAGRVVRLAVEEGEVAVPGTFSRETGLLMTIADLSVILAKVQVDETDVVRLARRRLGRGHHRRLSRHDLLGRVTQISHSAKMTATQTASGSNDRAVDFDVEITLDSPPRDIRPDLSCTARMVTDTRQQALSIPIIALTVRDHERVPNENPHLIPPAQAAGQGGRGRVRGAGRPWRRSGRSRSASRATSTSR